jgi:hypothetical protein
MASRSVVTQVKNIINKSLNKYLEIVDNCNNRKTISKEQIKTWLKEFHNENLNLINKITTQQSLLVTPTNSSAQVIVNTPTNVNTPQQPSTSSNGNESIRAIDINEEKNKFKNMSNEEKIDFVFEKLLDLSIKSENSANYESRAANKNKRFHQNRQQVHKGSINYHHRYRGPHNYGNNNFAQNYNRSHYRPQYSMPVYGMPHQSHSTYPFASRFPQNIPPSNYSVMPQFPVSVIPVSPEKRESKYNF